MAPKEYTRKQGAVHAWRPNYDKLFDNGFDDYSFVNDFAEYNYDKLFDNDFADYSFNNDFAVYNYDLLFDNDFADYSFDQQHNEYIVVNKY